MTQLLQSLDQPRGWSMGIRLVLCGVAGLLNAIDMGFQGNGNLILSGMVIGFILGLTWSASLLFGLPSLMRGFRPPLRLAIWGASVFAVLALLIVICFQIWGSSV